MIRFRGILASTGSLRFLSTEAVSERSSRVVIPPAIERSPTDLLDALSDTVGTDPTAPHFAFIDDPAMIPSTAQAKRNYYMAKEMGKRAARQLAEEWPTLFEFDRDEPKLPAFRPQKPGDPLKVEPTEANLLSMIENREVEDAAMLYERMRADNMEVKPEVQLELFRLMSYYNGKNVPFAEWEEWHGLRALGESETTVWTEAGLADLLFETLPKTSETVSILICGLCKHGNPTRAREVFKEFSGSVKILAEAWNWLIETSPWNAVLSMANEMKSAGVEPTVNTFNAMLASAARSKKLATRLSAFESIIGEMGQLGIVPTLRSYDFIISNIFEFRGQETEGAEKDDAELEKSMKLAVTWLTEIVADLESRQEITVSSAQDHLFFINAMGVAARCGNLDLAERIVSLYELPANQVKLPVLTAEGRFYNRYLTLYIDHTQSIEDIDRKYRSLVPRLVGAGKQLTGAVCQKLKTSPHWPLLLRIVEDAICSRQMTDLHMGNMMRERLAEVQYQSLSVAEREEYSSLIRRLVDIWMEFSRFTEEWNRRMQMKLSPMVISDCALLLNRIGDGDRAYQLLNLLLSPEAATGDEATVRNTGFARFSAMMELFEDALRQSDPIKAATCLEIMSATMNRQKLEPLAQRIHDRCQLTDVQSRIINGFVRLRPQ